MSGIGAPLRAARERLGLSLRELARRVGVTASHISLIETGKSKPSVETLYRIAGELRLSIDELLAQTPAPRPAAASGRPDGTTTAGSRSGPVLRRGQRTVIHLESGVRWERLTHVRDPDVDFLYCVYDVGGASGSDPAARIRHEGTEYVLVLEGELTLTLGSENYAMETGDSASFDAAVPHGYATAGDTPARFVSFVMRTR